MPENENHAFDVKFEGTTVVATLDPNKDGKPLAKFELDLMQVPQEVKDLIK